MFDPKDLSRRTFVGGVAGALAYLSIKPGSFAWGQGRGGGGGGAMTTGATTQAKGDPIAEYDAMAKLANNENPYGPPESVMKAMNGAWKYSNRYGYPDPNVPAELAKLHDVKPENIILGVGSSEILDLVGTTFLKGDQMKVVGAEPTYGSVYQHATGIKAAGITVPLLPDYTQDIKGMISATKKHYREIGFVYLCNPNNPTGRIVTKSEVKQLLDAIPDDMPVLIDEAYHHFIESSDYATSIPYVKEGRQVIIARTFSKIVGLAGMRLGYAVAPTELIQKMSAYSVGKGYGVNALVKFGAVAALKDTDAQAKVKKINTDLRKKTVSQLSSLGFESIPSETNFFMVHIKRPVQPVIDEFKKKNVLVGRPFPPMTEHLRVSVGTADEMDRFVKAFKEIFVDNADTAKKAGGTRR